MQEENFSENPEQNEQIEQTTQPEKKPMRFKKLRSSIIFQTFTLLLTLVILAGVGAAIAVVKHRLDYEAVATKYFNAYLLGDTEDMYEYVDIEESEFVNYSQFALKMASERAAISISEYKFGKPEKNGGTVTYTVTYENEVSEEEESFVIVLKQYRENWYNIIPEYKVIVDDRILSDMSVEIPEGTDLYIDDQLAVSFVNDEEAQTDIYDIDYIFEGEHTFYVESKYGEATLIQTVEENGTDIVIATEDIAIKDTEKTEIIEGEKEFVEAFYECAIDTDKSYKDVKSYVPDDDEIVGELKSCFSDTRDVLFPDSISNVEKYTITNLTFGEMEYEVASFDYPDKAEITCIFRYEYSASTDATLLSSRTDEYSGSCKTKITFNYEADDENGWTLTGLKMSNDSSLD